MQTLEPIIQCHTIAKKLKEIDSYQESYGWDPTTLSHGYPGLICLFTELHSYFPNEKWDIKRHHCIELLVQ
jgi:hypothetical protein